MPQQALTFRDFGILPEGLSPPPEKLRCFVSTRSIVVQYFITCMVSAVGLGLTVLFALTLPLPLSLVGGAAALTGFAAFVYLATHNDYRWVELDGNTLRAMHLYTGRTIERCVDEIERVTTLVYLVRSIETAVIETLLGRVKGVEIRFRDRGTPLRILRAEPAMINAKELIEAIFYRMARNGELECEIADFKGQLLLRNIHWKGEDARTPAGTNLNLYLGCLIGSALIFGTLFAWWGLEEDERRVVSSVAPHEIALSSLIQNGPGSNRHVTITDFRSGGYAFEARSGAWTRVWIALFPTGTKSDEPHEIEVVLSSKEVGDEDALRRLLQHGRVIGICSKAPQSGWGATLGPRLIEANRGCQLSSAWSIEDLSEPPTATLVAGILTCATFCLAAVPILALIVFWKPGLIQATVRHGS